MLEIKELSYKIGDRQILDKISFKAERGHIFSVIGPNGAGKSTLMKLIAGIIPPLSGGVFVDGDDLADMNKGERAKRVSYLPQRTEAVTCSVYDAVLLGRKPFMGWRPSERDFERTEEVLKYAGLYSCAEKCVTKLSGGEFQKVLIARALVQDSPVMLLDEPINHLDIKNRIDVMDMTAEITADNNMICVIVMHDLNLALRYSDRLLIMENGCARSCCDAKDADSGLISSVYQIPVGITEYEGRPAAIY